MKDSGDEKELGRVDRRQSDGCRRRLEDRRVSGERRRDRRGDSGGGRRSLKAWLRTLTNPRLGVDRRRGGDQRSSRSRRNIRIESLLSRAELTDLLK